MARNGDADYEVCASCIGEVLEIKPEDHFRIQRALERVLCSTVSHATCVGGARAGQERAHENGVNNGHSNEAGGLEQRNSMPQTPELQNPQQLPEATVDEIKGEDASYSTQVPQEQISDTSSDRTSSGAQHQVTEQTHQITAGLAQTSIGWQAERNAQPLPGIATRATTYLQATNRGTRGAEVDAANLNRPAGSPIGQEQLQRAASGQSEDDVTSMKESKGKLNVGARAFFPRKQAQGQLQPTHERPYSSSASPFTSARGQVQQYGPSIPPHSDPQGQAGHQTCGSSIPGSSSQHVYLQSELWDGAEEWETWPATSHVREHWQHVGGSWQAGLPVQQAPQGMTPSIALYTSVEARLGGVELAGFPTASGSTPPAASLGTGGTLGQDTWHPLSDPTTQQVDPLQQLLIGFPQFAADVIRELYHSTGKDYKATVALLRDADGYPEPADDVGLPETRVHGGSHVGVDGNAVGANVGVWGGGQQRFADVVRGEAVHPGPLGGGNMSQYGRRLPVASGLSGAALPNVQWVGTGEEVTALYESVRGLGVVLWCIVHVRRRSDESNFKRQRQGCTGGMYDAADDRHAEGEETDVENEDDSEDAWNYCLCGPLTGSNVAYCGGCAGKDLECGTTLHG